MLVDMECSVAAWGLQCQRLRESRLMPCWSVWSVDYLKIDFPASVNAVSRA